MARHTQYQYTIIFTNMKLRSLVFSSEDVDFGGLSYPTETCDHILWSEDRLFIDFKDGSSIMIPLTSIVIIKRIKIGCADCSKCQEVN